MTQRAALETKKSLVGSTVPKQAVRGRSTSLFTSAGPPGGGLAKRRAADQKTGNFEQES
jgi:hypothetical protein